MDHFEFGAFKACPMINLLGMFLMPPGNLEGGFKSGLGMIS